MPVSLKDSLMAWRWVEKIEGTTRSGIILQTTDETENLHTPGIWQDGSQIASDGDLLTAYSLLLAHERGWSEDEDLLNDAKQILEDFRKKAVIDFKAGEMVNALKSPHPGNMSFGIADSIKEGSIRFKENNSETITWEGYNNYVVFWHNPPYLNLENLDKISIKMRGMFEGSAQLDFRLEDVVEGEKIGHVYKTMPIVLADSFKTYDFTKDDFAMITDSVGVKEGELDYSRVKNLQFQLGPNYKYIDGGFWDDGSYQSASEFEWSGRKCYQAIGFHEFLNLEDVHEIKLDLRGTGTVDVMLIDSSGVYYHTGTKEIRSEGSIFAFDLSNFNQFTYTGRQAPIDWSRIDRIQFQSDYDVDVALNNIDIIWPEKSIKIAPHQFAEVELQSIQITLTESQSKDSDGLHLTSNGYGAPYVNPSYFMPFAYRKFMEFEDEELNKEFWQELLDNTYEDLEKSLEITLHDVDGNPIGEADRAPLFPNWFELDRLTGKLVDISIQKKTNEIRGYEYGFDAFRTVAYLCISYYLDNDDLDLNLLKKIYPFFKKEIENGDIKPVYRIDGAPVVDDEAAYGFYAVYLNLFNIMENFDNVDKILQKYKENRSSEGNRIWIKSDEDIFDGGKTEYYMNFWSFFGNFFYDSYSYEKSQVRFNDANMEAAVREAINKLSGDILASDVLELTNLDASKRNISDLSGIDQCHNLEVLHLEGNKIEDLSPLTKLDSLQLLNLSDNQISDIQPLVDNVGIGTGDEIDLRGNLLNEDFPHAQFFSLTNRGVEVFIDFPESPVVIDFNLADGDQKERIQKSAIPETTVDLQLNAIQVPEINGWSVDIEYDPTQLRYVSDSFQASDFIPEILARVDDKGDTISVVSNVLGTAGKNSGDGTLGTLSFEVLEGFTDSTELVITRVTFYRLDGVEDKRAVRSVATITSESILLGDCDNNVFLVVV